MELVKSMLWGKLNASTHLGLVISYPVQLGQLTPLEGAFFSLDALRVQFLLLSLLSLSQQATTVLGYG